MSDDNLIDFSSYKNNNNEYPSLDLFEAFSVDFEDSLKKVEEYQMSVEEQLKEAKQVENKIKESHTNELLIQYKESVISTIINTFGLSAFFQNDKHGGNVTTLHNAEKGGKNQEGLFANESDKQRFKQEYNSKTREVYTPNWKTKIDKHKTLNDEYTGKPLDRGNLDHIISAKQIHSNNEARLYMGDEARGKMATDGENLAYTSGSINKSKRAEDLMEWKDSISSEGNITNSEKYEINKEMANEKYRKAQEHLAKTVTRAKTKYYIKNVAETGINEGIQMGKRQVIGLFLYEFISSLTEELKLYYRSFKIYMTEKVVVSELVNSFKRVSNRVLSKSKEMIHAFGEGFVSGFLSNLITVMINTFVSTHKKIVRIIREGFYSLIKAVKILISPPPNISRQDLMRQVLKLFTLGLIVTGGILLEWGIEEAIANSFPLLREFANIIALAVSGILVGIISVTAMYFIDRWTQFIRESTHTLLTEGQQLSLESNRLEGDWNQIKDIHTYDSADDYINKMKKTDRNIKNIIDFFEE